MSERLHTPSLARRVALVVLALLAALLLAMGLLLDTVLSARLDSQLRDRLLDRASFAEVLAEETDARDLASQLEGEDISVRVTTDDGEVFTAGRVPGGADAALRTGGAAAEGPQAAPAPPPRPPETEIEETTSVLSLSTEVDGLVIDLFADRSSVDRLLVQVRVALLLSALAVLAVAAVAVGPVTGRALAPLGSITGVARAITAGDRGRRLRPDRPGTELGRTASAFDDMLDAVEGAERQARESEARLRDFVSDAAHELRTPVAGIRATAEHLLRTGVDRVDRDQHERLLLTLVRESARASRLVEDLLLMARIDRGLELTRSTVDVGVLAEEVVAARAVSHPGVTMGVHGGAAPVSADADRLHQVVTNLVDNAAQATRDDGRVEITVSQSDGRVLLEVADDGPGVPAGERERVFERLVRLDASRERRTGGVGLGLPIARGIVRAHGGELTYVDGHRLGGACFRLWLPRVAVPSAGRTAL